MATDTRRGWRLVAAMGVLAMVMAACGVDDPPDEAADEVPDPDDYCAAGAEGPVRWAHEQEPPDLQISPTNNLSITYWIQQGVFEGLYNISTEMTFVPSLLADDAEVVEHDDGSVTYEFELRDDLRFSDGEPITGQTIRDNYDLFMDEDFISLDRFLYELIDPDSWEVDGQSFSFSTDEFFAGWQTMFPRVYPTHTLPDDGEAANEAMRGLAVDGEPLPASGPFQFSDWNPEVSMTLVRNDDYHGAHPDDPEVVNQGIACATELQILWVSDTNAQITGVRGGEADFVFTQPQVAFGEGLVDDPGVTSAPGTSAAFEHWSMNIHNVHLSDPDVREALAYAMDKSVVMEELYEPIYGDALPSDGLGNSRWLPGSPYYVDHQGEQGYGRGDVEAAAELLEGAGYELNADGIYEHPDRGPLSLRVSTTGGNELRELQQQLLQDQLSEAGFDIDIDNPPGPDFFGERPFSAGNLACAVSQGDHGATVPLSFDEEAVADCEVVDIAQFTYVGGPWPGDGNIVFRGGSEQNMYGYANPDLDQLMEQCEVIVDDEDRAACYNETDRYVTTRLEDDNGLIILPLTVKPNFFAYSNTTTERAPVVVDANEAGPLVHAVDFLPSG